jgi:putative sigma-54 modulation protein
MQIIIKSRQMEVTPRLRQRIEHKLQRLARFLDEEARVEVTVTEEQTRSARERYSVRLALSGNCHPARSEVSAVNANAALDVALDKIMAQLGRKKDRQTTLYRQHTPGVKVLALERSGQLSALEEQDSAGRGDGDRFVEEEENERIWSEIMEIRRLPTRPMSDREVIEQMEKTGASFLPFFNEATNSVNVMYKLEQGGYGLLVPAVE